jgi:hypothetical protein
MINGAPYQGLDFAVLLKGSNSQFKILRFPGYLIFTIEHEPHQMLPIIKRHELKQGSELFEESAPGGRRMADGPVSLVQPFKRGMGEESQ